MNRPPPDIVYDPPLDPFIDVIHHDDDLLVLAKQSGLLTVPGKRAEHKDCLETRVRLVFPTATTVHRLDKDTSGIVVMALNRKAHRHLGLQFERRKLTKTYIADIWGVPDQDDGTIDLPLICDWPNRPRQMVDHERGRNAVTHWKVLRRYETTTRVELTPLTGRSHQLRVHMLSLGNPIIGDVLYAHESAVKAANRLHLHASEIELHHPRDGKRIRFTSPCPF